MFAVLEVLDFCMIALIVSLFAGGGTVAYRLFKPSDRERLRRLESKVDLILQHMGLEFHDPATPAGLSEEVKALLNDPTQKINAIALHRRQTGVGLKAAKEAVEAYIESRR
jgi:hypothetical protein